MSFPLVALGLLLTGVPAAPLQVPALEQASESSSVAAPAPEVLTDTVGMPISVDREQRNPETAVRTEPIPRGARIVLVVAAAAVVAYFVLVAVSLSALD